MKVTTFFRKKDKKNFDPPTIFMEKAALAKVRDYSDLKDVEVMLFGEVEKQDDNTYVITDFHVPPQEKNSTAFVTTHDEQYSKWLNDMPREKRKKLRVHYHTHPKSMSTSPSGTDENTITEKVENISDYYIRMIGNAKDSFHVDFFDITNNLLFKEIEIYVQVEEFLTIKLGKDGISVVTPRREEATKELDEKMIKSPTVTQGTLPKSTTPTSSFYGYPYEDYDSPQSVMDDLDLAENLSAELHAYNSRSKQSLTYQQLDAKLKPQKISGILNELNYPATSWNKLTMKEKQELIDDYINQYYDGVDQAFESAMKGAKYGKYY